MWPDIEPGQLFLHLHLGQAVDAHGRAQCRSSLRVEVPAFAIESADKTIKTPQKSNFQKLKKSIF